MRRGLYRIFGTDGRPNDVRVDDEGISVPVEEGIYRERGYQPPVNELPWEEDYCVNKRPRNLSPHFLAMTGDADFPGFKSVIERWRAEYGRIRKLGGGDYWKGEKLEDEAARSKCHLMPLASPIIAQCGRLQKEATEERYPFVPLMRARLRGQNTIAVGTPFLRAPRIVSS